MTLDQALAAVETEILDQTAELSGALREVCRYATVGGRRVRAALLLSATTSSGPDAVQAAAALELLHAATLLQDDIFDAGDVRRGRAATHVQFGRPMAILASDWLLIRSLEMASELHPVFFRRLARAGTAMVHAEARELELPTFVTLQDAEHHLNEVARGKTATLFSAALYGAGVLTGQPLAMCEQWGNLGSEIGSTYQMLDDCIDLYGTEDCAGKTLGRDLKAGCLTMPVLVALNLLHQQNIDLSLTASQSGRLGKAETQHLNIALYSARVTGEVQKRLENRISNHYALGRTLGVGSPDLERWLTQLCRRAQQMTTQECKETQSTEINPSLKELRSYA